MGEFASYSLSDLLLFAPETYWRLFARANMEQWPLPLLLLPAGPVAVAVCLWPRRAGLRLLAGLTGLAMIAVAGLFLWNLYRPINWAMAYAAPVYAGGGLMLLVFAAVHEPGPHRRQGPMPGVLMALAVCLYPLLSIPGGRLAISAEFAAIAPDPTAGAALAVALLAHRRSTRWLLSVVPLIWLGLSAATLNAMDAAQWVAPGGLAALALLALLGPPVSRQR